MKPEPKRPRANIVEAMDGIFKPWFPGDTWSGWKSVLKAMDGLPMTETEVEFFKSVAGGREPPIRRVSEFVAACARRTGKDSVVSAVAAHSAALFDQQDRLRPGEKAQVLCLACDRDQSKIILNYIRSYFTDIPALKEMVVRTTATGFELRNNVDITVATSSFRAVRGKPILLAIMDEAAFMLSETSASPDTELYTALKPALLTIPGSRIVIISSPYRKSGLLWNRYKKCFGENDDRTLVIQASVRELNPTISQEAIDAEVEADPAAAVSELFGQFRDDISSLMPLELIEAAVDTGVLVRPPQKGFTYHCGVDPSGGVHDSFTAAISHAEEDGNIVLDALLEIKSPCDPVAACEQVAGLIKAYGLSSCTGDKYSAQFVVSTIAKHGVVYKHSERDRSKIYADVLACFTSGRARLLDTPKNRLVVQFAGLQRTTHSMGRDKIDHQKGQKDDLANAASLSMVLAAAPAYEAPQPVFGTYGASGPFSPHLGQTGGAGTNARAYGVPGRPDSAAYSSSPQDFWDMVSVINERPRR